MPERALLCLFGVINRSIKCTWKNINSNIVEHLKKNNIETDVYVFNLVCDNGLVDGVNVNNNDHTIIESTFYECKSQSVLDHDIKEKIETVPYKPSYVLWYTDNQIHNTMRQMYSEYRVGAFIRTHMKDYDYAIVCGPDYYVTKPINIHDLRKSKKNNMVYISDVNPGMNGYTNGYYVSSNLKDMSIMLCRYEHILPFLKDFKGDYEQLLKKYCDANSVQVMSTDQVFFKIRANKTIFWQGFNDKHKEDDHNKTAYQSVMKEFDLRAQEVFEKRC